MKTATSSDGASRVGRGRLCPARIERLRLQGRQQREEQGEPVRRGQALTAQPDDGCSDMRGAEMKLTLRALSALLGYPSAELHAHTGEVCDTLRDEVVLPSPPTQNRKDRM